MGCLLDDTEARKALRQVQIRAVQQWQRESYRCDLSEYEDAGIAALTGCLARFDPSRGITFTTYAAYRINGVVHDAAEAYQSWRHGVNIGAWKQAPPNADVLRPLTGAQPDPVLRARLLRELPTLSRCDAQLLMRLLGASAAVPLHMRKEQGQTARSLLCSRADRGSS